MRVHMAPCFGRAEASAQISTEILDAPGRFTSRKIITSSISPRIPQRLLRPWRHRRFLSDRCLALYRPG